MFSRIVRRNLFVFLTLSFFVLPVAASAATVELMSLKTVKTQEADGDEIQLRISVDGAVETVWDAKTSNGLNWSLGRKFNYTKNVRVRVAETDVGNATTILGDNVLTNKAGIYLANFTQNGGHYVLTYQVTPTPPAPTAQGYVLQLNWLQAVKTQEGGGDEIQLKYSSDGGKTNVLSKTMKTGNVWKINKDIPFTKKAPVNIYDEDLAFDDLIGGMVFLPTHFSIAYTTKVFQNSDGTRYILSYRVLRK